ncbi:hypothetical protein TrLO_g3848 [Triparma laevis f. longispina]|uniref:Kinesin light chain n=1 Tax=Triparma laevis f. longispina TaxID=1714387 RepID=A0A9W7CAQ0_9STRA|nr:hypothetical protein TrLO_g3848 [Triparma laevis f. longispina]
MFKLISITCSTNDVVIEKLRDLLKRMERALGEENVVTLDTLNQLDGVLKENEEYGEAIKVHERCLVGRMKVLGEDHQDTLDSLNNLGVVYDDLKNYEKDLEYYERALKGFEETLRKNHPSTLDTVMNIAIVARFRRKMGKLRSFIRERSRDTRRSLGKIIKTR